MDVSTALKKMHKHRAIAREKGDYGEKAVLALIKDYQSKRGGVIYHSFTYPYQSNAQGVNYAGNLHWSGQHLETYDGTASTHDEIDILYITNNRIFALEVKARVGPWKVYDFWCRQQSKLVDKSPIAQAEKHARHLYHLIYAGLPEGNPDYIIPMTVFVDKAVIEDIRNESHQSYLPLCILNNFISTIMRYDTPLDYHLDIKYLSKILDREGKGTKY